MSSPSPGKRRMDTDVVKLYPLKYKQHNYCNAVAVKYLQYSRKQPWNACPTGLKPFWASVCFEKQLSKPVIMVYWMVISFWRQKCFDGCQCGQQQSQDSKTLISQITQLNLEISFFSTGFVRCQCSKAEMLRIIYSRYVALCPLSVLSSLFSVNPHQRLTSTGFKHIFV